jgi:hypothetical protein
LELAAPVSKVEGMIILSALYAAGFIRQVWQRGDVGGACLLAEADGEEAVRATLATLPLVKAGMLEIVAVIPLKPYRGFGPRA